MNREQILAKITEILVGEFEIDEASIKPEATLNHDLGLDSIDAIDVAVRLQAIIGKRIEEEALRELRTVNDVINLVDRHLNA